MEVKDEKVIEVLQSRYELVRNELVMRLDYRYKLFQLSLVIVPAFASFIWKLKWYYAGFGVSIFYILIISILLFEAKQIIFISDYLYKIEKYLDETLNLPCKGWEIYTRASSNSSKKGTNSLAIAFVFLFSIPYFIGIGIGLYGMYKDNIALIYLIIVFIFSMLPLILVTIGGLNLKKIYWS